jgi:outer membrane protein OmpA-like peptidoglycan-associated protein
VAGDALSGAADVAGDVVSGAADVAGKAGAAVAGAAGAAVAGMAGLASGAGGAVHGLIGDDKDGEGGSMRWLWWLLLLLLLLLLLWWLFFKTPSGDAAGKKAAVESSAAAVAMPSAFASAPAEGQAAIPSGEGVTTEMRDGKPVVKVYFSTGKTSVPVDLDATASGLKAYLDANAGSTLAVSGYNDASGNAAANAKLSKARAEAVKAAIVKAGAADASVALVKPENTTDGTVPAAAARRVEVSVK